MALNNSLNIMKIYRMFFLLLLVLSASCKKGVFDHRNKYLGNWNIKATVIMRIPNGEIDTLVRSDNQTNFDGEITKAEDENEMWVPINDWQTTIMTVSKKGEFSGSMGEGEIERKSFYVGPTAEQLLEEVADTTYNIIYEGSRN